jgi:hypothetical protein
MEPSRNILKPKIKQFPFFFWKECLYYNHEIQTGSAIHTKRDYMNDMIHLLYIIFLIFYSLHAGGA